MFIAVFITEMVILHKYVKSAIEVLNIIIIKHYYMFIYYYYYYYY